MAKGDLKDYSQKFWALREQLWQTLEDHLEGKMFIPLMIRAINEGVGEQYVLALQEMYEGRRTITCVGGGLPPELNDVIRDYKPKEPGTAPS